MTIEQRISKGQEPYTYNEAGHYDMAPVGVLMFAAESLHSTKGLPPESPHVIAASNLMVQRVAAIAKRNGCPDTGRWLDGLTTTRSKPGPPGFLLSGCRENFRGLPVAEPFHCKGSVCRNATLAIG